MGQRPSFDMARLSTADKILLVASALFFIDSFLPWQRVCAAAFGDFPGICVSANLWGGNGSFFGLLAGLLALALLIWEGLSVAGVNLNVNMPRGMVSAALAGGVLLFTVIKFLFVIGNSPGIGAWLGLILALAIAYGGYMKWQEEKAGGGLTT